MRDIRLTYLREKYKRFFRIRTRIDRVSYIEGNSLPIGSRLHLIGFFNSSVNTME